MLSDEAPLLGTAAADVLLDGVKRGDVLQRLTGNRRRAKGSEFVEVTPHMRPESKRNLAPLGELGVAGIAVLQDSLEACQMGDRSVGFAIGSVDVGDAWRISAAPRQPTLSLIFAI